MLSGYYYGKSGVCCYSENCSDCNTDKIDGCKECSSGYLAKVCVAIVWDARNAYQRKKGIARTVLLTLIWRMGIAVWIRIVGNVINRANALNARRRI